MQLLISGYGGKSGDTAGIYDTIEKRYIWKSGVPCISFMCTGGQYIFGAGEHGDGGFVYMFAKRENGYALSDTLKIPGSALCHIAYSQKHSIVTGACYGSGEVFSAAVENGRFGPVISYIRQGEDGELSRAHCTVFDPGEQYMYSANIALDRVYKYEVIDDGLRERGFTQLDKGVGPRHILISGDCLYVITEYSNEIITVIDSAVAGRVSTLPGGFHGESFCSTLCMSADGYIYAANRGANTIAVLERGNGDGGDYKSGKGKSSGLVKVHDCPCSGDWPRHIALINDNTLAIANQNSGHVVLTGIKKDASLDGIICDVPFEGASFVSLLIPIP